MPCAQGERKCNPSTRIWNPTLFFLWCLKAHIPSLLSQTIILGDVSLPGSVHVQVESVVCWNALNWVGCLGSKIERTNMVYSRVKHSLEPKTWRAFSKWLGSYPKPMEMRRGRKRVFHPLRWVLSALLLITSAHARPAELFWKRISQHFLPYNSTCVLFPVSLTSPNSCLITRNSQK